MLLAGVLPFGAIFIELYFVMNSIWFNRIYYMFGFLFLCYGLMVVTSAAVTILMVYFLLCKENYHWQWRSFFTAGASAGYVFAYALLYWLRALTFTSWTSGVLYMGYSALAAAVWFVLTGEFLSFLLFFFFFSLSLLVKESSFSLIKRHHRHYRLLRLLDVRPSHLWLAQDRLSFPCWHRRGVVYIHLNDTLAICNVSSLFFDIVVQLIHIRHSRSLLYRQPRRGPLAV